MSGKANRRRVLTSGSPRFLHLAAPSFFRPYTETSIGSETDDQTRVDEVLSYNPLLRLGLDLASSEGTGTGDRLTALDLRGLDLSGTELVMLTGWEPTETVGNSWGISGLRQVIVNAGAHSLITNLWPVPDELRLNFVLDFYGRLKAGSTCSAPLRATQQQLRSDNADPAVWGAFVRLGEVDTT